MAYTRKNIKNLTGGVSQQPDSERFDNQCSEQKNFLADPIKGLTKRAGTNYVQILSTGTHAAFDHHSKNTFTHVINRSSGEQLMLVVGYDGSASDTSPEMQLYKLNEEGAGAVELTITDGTSELSANSHNYLDVGEAYETHPYSAVTIADYTFLANKSKTPALKSTTSHGVGMFERDHVKRGLIFIKEGAYGTTYEVKATDSEGTTRTINLRTSRGNDDTKIRDIDTNNIAGAIHKCLEASEDSDSGTFADTSGSGGSDEISVYGDANTGIAFSFSDDSDINAGTSGTLYRFNAEKLKQGSNYIKSSVDFVTNAQANDEIRITGCIEKGSTGAAEVLDFKFSGTTSGSEVAVTLGTTMLESMENLVTAINSKSTELAVKAHLVHDEDWYQLGVSAATYKVFIHSTREGATDSYARGGVLSRQTGDDARFTVTAFTTGSSDVDATSQSLSPFVSPPRNTIYFKRITTGGYGSSQESKGSVIAWYASFASKEEADASPINIEITDGYGGTLTESYTDVIDNIEALPTLAPNNYVLKVQGNEESDQDDYYLKFSCNDENATVNEFGTGRWEETLDVGLQYQLDASTMPHQLIKVDETTYKFVEATWQDKSVGDATSDKTPSFVDKSIQDMFFFKGRLGVLAGESVIMSEVDNAYNFWRTSVSSSIDSDRVDISSSVNEITYLNWAVPFANQLVVFSDRAQFLVTHGNQGLTPSTAALSLGSSYENSTICRPVVNDNSIVFAQQKSGASAVYEMYPTGNTEISFEAKSISEHIPSYISGKITKIAASSLANTIVVQTNTGDNGLYIYRYYNQGKSRVQSSWSKYELASDYIKGCHFIGDKFHNVEGHHIEGNSTVANCYWIFSYTKFDNTDSLTNSVDLYYNPTATANLANDGSDTVITMDDNFPIRDNTKRNDLIVVFNKSTNQTYTLHSSQPSEKYKIKLSEVNLQGNTNIVVGLKFTASYEFSKQYIKKTSQDGKQTAVTDGRTTTKWYEIYFNDSQYLKSTVSFPSYTGKSPSIKEFSGNPDNTITGVRAGEQPSETSTLRTSVAARSDLPTITLSSDTHQTVTITGAAFELMHTSRLSRTN